KPMNCPFHIEIFRSRPRSYRDLPMRYAEFGTVYRYELSGVLQGLTRVRGFTQDDAHTFCTPDQVGAEIVHALRFSLYVLRTFGLTDFKAYISTKPPQKAIGTDRDWEEATGALRAAVESQGLPYEYDVGGGAFYGPKIDLKVRDSLGREWQLSTVQFDFNLPERFQLEYRGNDGAFHRPFMVHRALFGSVERFFAMLVEHFAGVFPLWLAPTQVVVVPIADRHNAYAYAVRKLLRAAGMRAEADDRDERMQAKVRDAEIEKIPFVFVVGDKEAAAGTVSVRSRDKAVQGVMTVASYLDATEEQRKVGTPEPLDD
ncbi:MAG TPA: threonine--tRNA ligase, partial [Dongiaceae bacterium]|nr:threonine--tRNA ligase [Dongiaceae bacterium]